MCENGGSLEQIVDGKQHKVADFLADAVVIALSREEAPQPLLADIGFDRQRISAFAR